MSTYVSADDYLPRIQDAKLQQIIASDDTLLDEVEQTAIVIIKDALHTRYDVEAIFALTGNSRHRQVVRWVISLALYFLHERIPDRATPPRVIKNYDDTLAYLLEIEDGKKSVDLPRLVNSEDMALTKFRYGSEPRQEH